VVRTMQVTGTNLRPQSRRWRVQPKGFASTTARLQITVETDFKELKPLLAQHYELIDEQQHQHLQAVQGEQLLVLQNQDEQPATYALQAKYPNPFNPTTTISYQLPERAEVSLKVYNLTGRLVQTLVQKSQQPGRYAVDFDASGLASGVYLYRLQAGDYSKVKRMLLIK